MNNIIKLLCKRFKKFCCFVKKGPILLLVLLISQAYIPIKANFTPYTSKHLRGKTFAVFTDFSKMRKFTIESFPSSQLENNFKIEKHGPPLPDPSGLLNQHLSSSAIEEANKEVTAVLGDPVKRHLYLKISPEQKAIIARYAVNHGIVNAVRQFSKDFPENSLKESMIRVWKKTYLKELSSQKKAGKDMTVETLTEKKLGVHLC